MREFFIPIAHAREWTLQGVGDGPGVRDMFTRICAVMPFCAEGPQIAVTFTVKLITFIFAILSGAAVCVLLYAAIKFIMSQGNEEGIEEAKKITKWALGGLILAITAEAIVYYFVNVVVPQLVGG